MSILKSISNELQSGPIKWVASILSILVAIIVISQYISVHNSPPIVDALISDELSPQEAGKTIIWTANAIDPENDPIQYKFFLNGNSVTEWSPQDSWTWTSTKANIGENHIDVCIRDGNHANQNSYDSSKTSNFIISDPNRAPIIQSLTSNLPSPQEAGTTVFWTALAYDSDNDQVQYRFLLDGQPKTKWFNNPNWIWTTSSDDIGNHVIEVKAKDAKHNSDGDDSKANDFAIVLAQNQYRESLPSSDYSRTNEYDADSLDPSCTPGSKQANCPSLDSCVDCDGACWSPGSYSGGKVVCSKGMWKIS